MHGARRPGRTRRTHHQGPNVSDARRQGFSIVGIGAAACVACCAGPILALLGGMSLAGLASTLVIGTAGVVIAVTALAGILGVRRRRVTAACQTTSPDPVAVATPSRKVRS